MEQTLTLDAIKHTRRFDGTLFQNWKHSMELMFEFKELKDLVDVNFVRTKIFFSLVDYFSQFSLMQGVEPIPEEEFEGEGDNAVCVNEEAIYSWRKRDCYARMLIFNANDETRQKALFNCRSSHEMWSRLNTQYLQRAADNKHLLHREFINLRYIKI